jgi:hypothetical protein
MNKVIIDGVTMALPTKEDIESLVVGEIAPTCFGEGPVKSIHALGTNIFGRRYVCYYAGWGHGDSLISHSLTEGQIEFPMDDQHSYAERCRIRHQHEPKPVRDHYGHMIDSNGMRIG